MTCHLGTPYCVEGTVAGCSSSLPGTAMAGFAYATITSNGTLSQAACGISGSPAGLPKPFSTNSSCGLASGTPIVFAVDTDCSVRATIMADDKCSQDGGNVDINGAYQTPTLITATDGGYTVQFAKSGGSVAVTYFSVTNKASEAATVGVPTCAGTIDVIAGSVAGDTATASSDCAPGATLVDGVCTPCPAVSLLG